MPVCEAEGVPPIAPVEVLKDAHAGRFCAEKVSCVPLFALVVGWNEYADPATAVVGGVPKMVSVAVTWMENAASALEVVPSLTLITMFEYVPTFAAPGVPDNVPVVLLKVSHEGRFATLKVS